MQLPPSRSFGSKETGLRAVHKHLIERSIERQQCCTERPFKKLRGFGLWLQNAPLRFK
jgi:hypothetical protein